MSKLRGKAEEHVGWLLRWFHGVNGADLVADSVRQTHLGEAGQRVHGKATIEVRHVKRHRPGQPGRLLAVLEVGDGAAVVVWCRPTHCGLVSTALKHLRETFGGSG